jgi:molybdopterin-guanine dinucleotide biosynthesis protein MobB
MRRCPARPAGFENTAGYSIPSRLLIIRKIEAPTSPTLSRRMTTADLPPIVSVMGKKNSGKTTLIVALAVELKRRGLRVGSLKHGHHEFEIDYPGRDSWRHFHEGEVEAVIMASGERVAMVMRSDEAERDPRRLLERLYGGRGYDLILVEGLKRGPFPKVEIFRRAVHEEPVYDPAEEISSAPHLAIVTDAPEALDVRLPVIPLQADGGHVRMVADVVQEHARGPGAG